MTEENKNTTTKQATKIPLGRPKSGRVWKNRNRKRFSAMRQGPAFNKPWEEHMKLRKELKLVKDREKELKAARQQKFDEKKQRREENQRRRAENQKKAEVVQVIKNTAKIRRMNKKQLKQIEKR